MTGVAHSIPKTSFVRYAEAVFIRMGKQSLVLREKRFHKVERGLVRRDAGLDPVSEHKDAIR